jgi:segregation and condensation protein A
LLLHLIQKARINIYDIPIAEITRQFLRYLEEASKLDLDDLTDFYAMAAHLIYMKSRLLIPSDEPLEEDGEFASMRSELVERLLEYQKYKRYSALLSDTGQGGELFIQRRKSQFMLPFEDQDLWDGISVWDLLKTFSSLLGTITPEQVFNVYEEVTTKQKLTLMAELFEDRQEISFLDIVVRPDSPMDVICAFLAILEAVKFSMITIFQHRLFGDIVIRRREDFDVAAIDDDDEPPYDDFIDREPEKGSRVEHVMPLYEDEDEQYDEVIDLDDAYGEDPA